MRRRVPHAVPGRATVTALIAGQRISIQHDGQPVSVEAVATYTTPAVGDRVLVLTVGRTMYATGAMS